MTPMSTSEILRAIITPSTAIIFEIEAEPHWYARDENDPTDGEAQAIIRIAERRYAISLEPLP